MLAADGVASVLAGVANLATALKQGDGAEGTNDGEEVGSGDKSSTTPSVQRGSPMNVPQVTNVPTTINGRQCTGHALDQMQGRGLTPTVVATAEPRRCGVFGGVMMRSPASSPSTLPTEALNLVWSVTPSPRGYT